MNEPMAGAKAWSMFPSAKYQASGDGQEVVETYKEFSRFYNTTKPNDNSYVLHESADAYMSGFAQMSEYAQSMETMEELFKAGFVPWRDGSDRQVSKMYQALNVVRCKEPKLFKCTACNPPAESSASLVQHLARRVQCVKTTAAVPATCAVVPHLSALTLARSCSASV